VGLFLLAGFLRLFQLQIKAYHHDESLHAYYSYKLYNGGRSEYTYDPTYHGPFLYHWTAFIFFLFGDSDFTGRFSFALFGMLMLYLILRLRPVIGTPGVIFVLAAAAVSPVLTYFSRFAREDIFAATMSFGIVVFALDYFRTKRPAHLMWMLFFLGLLYCTKENSLMTGFVFCSYVVFYGIYYVLSRPKETRRIALRTILADYAPFTKSLAIYGLFSFFTFFYSKLIISRINWSVISGDLGRSIVQSQMDSYLAEHRAFTATWITLAVLASVCVFAALWLVRRLAEGGKVVAPEGENRWKAIAVEYYPLVVGWALVVGLYCLLFSTLLSNRVGLGRGLVDYFAYWIGQQSIRPRISGELSYYLPRLALYETLPVLFGIAAYVYYLVRGVGVAWFLAIQIALLGGLKQFYAYINNAESFRANFAGHCLEFGVFVALAGLVVAGRMIYRLSLRRPGVEKDLTSPEPPVGDVDGYRLFLVYWSVSALVIYSILNEKVPWLLTHQALPLCLLAGTFAGDLWNLLGQGSARTVVTVAYCVLALYDLRCNILLNFHNPDNPREIMVYTQSTPDVVKVRDEVEHIAFLLGRDRFLVRRESEESRPRVESLVAVEGGAQWPYVWYFRRYQNIPGMPSRPLPPVVITDPDMDTRMQVMAGGQYTVRRYPLRAWWPPYAKTLWPFDAINDPQQPRVTNSAQAWQALRDYMWNRKVWSPIGSSDMLVYVRKDLLQEVPVPKAAEGYAGGPRTLQTLAVWGSPGAGPGQFVNPKGVAVSRDGQRIYVVDSGNARIQILSAAGQFQNQFGGPGKGPGQLDRDFGGGPCGGIAVGANGRIFVTDTWNHRILVFDQNGSSVGTWSQAGPGEFFFGPRGVAVAPDGRVFVADTGNKRLVVFTGEGKFLNTIGGEGAGPGQFIEPVGVAISQDGEIYVADVGNKRIQVLGPDGVYRREWNILGWTDDPGSMIWVEPYVALGPDGSVYVTDSTRKIVHRFDRTGRQVVLGSVTDGFRAPKGIACDPSGEILVADAERGQIVKFRFP
jgi:uncharacterized protein (TIGR03663 family)